MFSTSVQHKPLHCGDQLLTPPYLKPQHIIVCACIVIFARIYVLDITLPASSEASACWSGSEGE